MLKVLQNSTAAGIWHEVVHDAQAACNTPLLADVESYLVFLLIRYMKRPEVVKNILATQLLEGLQRGPSQRELALKGVADSCLLFSGLFPGIANKRLVKISYFVNIGRGAYIAISKQNNDLYAILAHQFVAIMDVLQSIRYYAADQVELLPIEAYDLWNEVGSKRALQILKSQTQGNVMPTQNEPRLIKPK